MAKKKNRAALTPLESEVMAPVWDAEPDPISVRTALDAVNQRRQEPLAYNTVHTVFQLLKQKGAIKQVATQGRAHLFVATRSREKTSRQMVGDLAKRLFGGEMKPFIHQMIDEADLSTEELKELRHWVDQKLEDSHPQNESSTRESSTRESSTRESSKRKRSAKKKRGKK